jgi:hypothetical protein
MLGVGKLKKRNCRNLQDFREMQALETLLGLLTMKRRVEEEG